MTPIQKHYRIPEVMQLLGLSQSTIYRMVAAGHLKLVKVGKRASAVPADSLRALMHGGKEK
ncbi:helix-turn-helix domain-containing protein [Paraburkholderia sp. RL17-368-BIF-A]|uniref:helix-turn-helix transcriptional regulator n=1 Tax=Paraburkholderia sp. RL17-368-BIF-A TaxID=3031628 RepID=UPI0038C41BCC